MSVVLSVATLPSGASPMADREILISYAGYRGNKIPGAEQSNIYRLAVRY
jgi:hypothetical protein